MGLLDRLEKQKQAVPGEAETMVHNSAVHTDVHKDLREKTHKEVIDIINKKSIKNDVNEESNESIRKIINDVLDLYAGDMNRPEKNKILKELYDDVVGLGPIEELLENPDVTEIMVNGPYNVYVEKKGKLTLSEVHFRDNEHVLNVIDRIVAPIGRRIDESNPMVDARLLDGSRVNAIIPPISLVGPVLTIRKFSKQKLSANDLINFGSLSYKMSAFLESCVKGKMNIVVSGGTGSGKTTLLNILSAFIPDNERIVTIEDAAELQLRQQHVITLESRPANLEGRGQITIRELVKNSLRMRPDRIVVGEVRSGETLDMLQAMNTGHDGSLTTAHANTPRDMLSRLETMVLMAGLDLPIKAIREQINSAIDIIVQQTRLRDGTRKVTTICEIVGMEGDIITTQDIFKYETDGSMDSEGKFKGRFIATGIKPKCVEKIKTNGIGVSDEWFTN